ncbi:MAG TPA: MFS transporter, partial [Brevibacterium sp.]|nr:MFS transporter [Brevibacterium sp.]
MRRAVAPGSRVLLVTAMCLGSMLTMFTSTLSNLLVPAIAEEFGASAVGLAWVATSYTLAYGALLLLGGALGSAYGRRRLLLIGTAVFAVASLGCAVAPSLELLLAGRVVQGAAVALYLPQTLAILSTEFTAPAARAKAVGLWAGVSSLGLSAGPVLGGVLVDLASWRVGFLLSTVLALAAFGMGARGVSPQTHGRTGPGGGIDVVGAIVGTAGLVGFVELLMRLPSAGLADPTTLACAVAAVV